MERNQDAPNSDPRRYSWLAAAMLICMYFAVNATAVWSAPPTAITKKPKVICFGDSITNRGYPQILSKLAGVEAINAGVGGNSTAKALRRLENDVLAQEPDAVVILFGTNDLRADADRVYVPVEKYKANLKSIIDQCRKQNARVVLCTLPPIEHEAFFTRHERPPFQELGGLAKLIENYRQAARQVAVEQKVPLVDLNQLLAKEPQWLSKDGVHPSDIGTSIIAKHVANVLNALLFPPSADFYVSPNGSDTWSGTLAEPNEQQTDGPFATLVGARDAVRQRSAAPGGNQSDDVVVLVRGGTYRLDETVVFGLQDSRQGHTTTTYRAYPGETPVFHSGRTIVDWKKATAIDAPNLPKQAVGKVQVADVSDRFYALFDEEGLLPRARSKAFIPLAGGSRNKLHCPNGLLEDWPNVKDVEVVVRPHHAWILNILPLQSIDMQQQVARTSINATYAMNRLHFLKDTKSCWVENALEELDEPGEWVLNTQTDKLYLWPRNDSPVMSPQLTELIRIEGKIDKKGPADTPVRNLCFRGLTFMHGDRYQIAEDDAGLQHDWDMHDKANAMFRLRGTENCRIEECRFAHSGSGAIRVDLHGQQNTISGNMIEHIGGAGILLCGYGPGTKDVNRKNVVYNNHIHHVGQIYSHSPGIMVWQSGENRIANNLVHHTPYTGIIISGCMTHFFKKQGRELGRTIRRHEIGRLPNQPQRKDVLPYLHTHDNAIELNEIHHAMEMLGDGNAIYIRGAGGGNAIRRNYIHHLVAPMKMQAAIRTDGGQTDTLIAENLVYKCTAQGIILKLNNRCENNIVADVIAPPRGYYLSVREGPMTGATIKRNIFYSSSKECTFIDELPAGKGRTTEDRRGRTLALAKQADTDQNIYFNANNPKLGQQMLEKQQNDGVDAHSLAVDPLFVDPENGDFRLKPDSPARKLGIVPIDLSDVGLQNRVTP